jgi:uncharacterized Zn finger protein
MRWSFHGFRPYVPVAKRRAQATREIAKWAKNGHAVSPVVIEGRKIANSFWGIAWCENLESYSDFDNRLPRGRTYVRNGSVVHLEIAKGKILARVSGSSLYTVNIEIDALPASLWSAFRKQSAGKVGTLVELLQGKLSKSVMEQVTAKGSGLFPSPKEIKVGCNCPDYAWLCKHAAAVLYGVGRRLDDAPELLFTLRGVDHLELIDQAVTSLPEAAKAPPAATLSGDLSALFGIEISDGTEVAQVKPGKKPNKKKPQNTKGKVAQAVGRGAKPKKANKQPVKAKTAKKDSSLKSTGVKAGAKAGVVKVSGKSIRTNGKTPLERSKPAKKVGSGGRRIGK